MYINKIFKKNPNGFIALTQGEIKQKMKKSSESKTNKFSLQMFRGGIVNILLLCIIICFTATLVIGILSMPLAETQPCNCQCDLVSSASLSSPSLLKLESKNHLDIQDNLSKKSSINNSTSHNHRLAILVPFRERFEELLQFAPHIGNFLNKQNLNYHIFILNQIDRYRFNRASLINVGFLYTKSFYDYIAMHDVDLLPLNTNLKYEYPLNGPIHISSPQYHPKYHYKTFVGGILLIKREHYQLLNGMSNMYWGWGLEDDEFYVRIKDAKLNVYRPENLTTGIENTFRHIHDRNHRKRDTEKCYNQREVTRKRDHKTGLNTVKYEIENKYEMYIEGIPITVLNIKLICNKTITPWCSCNDIEK